MPTVEKVCCRDPVRVGSRPDGTRSLAGLVRDDFFKTGLMGERSK
jgi:hypothetical protein